MRIVKQEKNSEIIDILKPYFIEDGDYTKDIAAEEFEQLMIFVPESICVLVGYEDGNISGFLIAHKVDNRGYVYLSQAVSVAEEDFSQSGMLRLVEWCKKQGINEIRCETERNSVQMICAKRYNFTEHGVMLARKI